MARQGVLTTKDLEDALDLVETVGQAETRDEFVSLTVEATIVMIPCMVAAVNEVDPAAKRFVYWWQPTSFSFPSNAQQLLLEMGNENPLIHHLSSTGDGSAHRFSDLVSPEELHATRLYQELYRPMGMEYQMSVTLPAQAPKIFAVVLGDDQRDFSERDRTILNRVRPHLAQIWRNVRDLDRLKSVAEMTRNVVAAHGWGVIVLSDPPEELMPGSFVTLYRHFGRPSRRSPFPATVEQWLATQRAVSSGDGLMAMSRPLAVQNEGSRVVLRYLPAGRSQPDAIMIGQPYESGPPELEALGLSGREAEVVHLVTSGVSNKEIAERLHISTGTVRKHLDNVYNKLGVRSRSALTAFIFDIIGG